MKTNSANTTKRTLSRLLAIIMIASLIASMIPTTAMAAAATNNAGITGTIPSTMVAGQSYTVSIKVKNTGKTTWTAAAGYKLVAVGGSDPFTSAKSIALAPTESVAPNATKTFTVTMTAPLKSGTMTSDWQMYKGSVKFGAVYKKSVKVTVAKNNSLITSVSAPSLVAVDTLFTSQINFKNIGSNKWTAKGGYKLVVTITFVGTPVPYSLQLKPTETIGLGGSKTFSFSMYSLPFPGTFYLTYQMYAGSAKFGQAVTKTINVEYTLDQATQLVEFAEQTLSQDDVDEAKFVLDTLLDSPERTALYARLHDVQETIDAINDYVRDLARAKAAVAAAEFSHLQSAVNEAQALVTDLRDSAFKNSLQRRLDAVQAIINLANAKTAAHADLNTAFAAYTQGNYSAANWTTLTAAKTAGDTAINAAITEAAVATAKNTAVAAMAAVKTLAQEAADALAAAKVTACADLNTAYAAYSHDNYSAAKWTALGAAKDAGIVAINGAASIAAVTTAKNAAVAAMDAVKTLAEEAADALAAADTAVAAAENSKLQADLDAAQALVTALPAGTAKTALQTRLDIVKGIIDAAKALEDATSAVAAAESSKLQADVDDAQALVTALPAGAAKSALQARLDDLQDSIDAAALEAARTTALANLDTAYNAYHEADYYTNNWVRLAYTKGEGIRAINAAASIADVQSAETQAEAAMAAFKTAAEEYAEVLALVVIAEGSHLQADVEAARYLVCFMPGGHADRIELETRIENVQLAIDSEAAAAVDALIAALPIPEDLTLADKDAYDAAVLALNGLTDSQFCLVTRRFDLEILAIRFEELRVEALVEIAEGSRLQADLDEAQAELDLLIDSAAKPDLQLRLYALQVIINGPRALATATAAVVKAEGSHLQADLNKAQQLVTALPDGADKDGLQARIVAEQNAIDIAAAAAADALIMTLPAPEDLTIGDKDAYDAVANAVFELTGGQMAQLTKGDVFAALSVRMNELVATSLVEKAEGSHLQADLDEAQYMVTDLNDGEVKTDLQARIDALQGIITADIAAAEAVDALIAALPAPGDLVLGDKDAYDAVIDAYKALTANQVAMLTKQDALDAVSARMNELVATSLVEKAEGSHLQADLDEAQAMVTDMPGGAVKADLQARLYALQVIIDEPAALANATAAVVKAEGSQLLADVDAARPLVNALPDGAAKVDLQTRLDELKSTIDNAAVAALEAMIAALPAPEDLTTADIPAIWAVTEAEWALTIDQKALLPQSDVMMAVMSRWNELLATRAVETAEDTHYLGDLGVAKDWVSCLDDGAAKTALQARIDTVQAAIDEAKKVATATTAVVAAEGNHLQAGVNKAQALVAALANGADKSALQARLDAVQAIINAAKAAAELADAKAAAVEDLNTAFGNYTETDYSTDNWNDLVAAKDNGLDAIDAATSVANVAAAESAAEAAMAAVKTAAEEAADALAAATAAVVKAEGSKLQADVDDAQALVTALPDGTDKDGLQARLDDVQDAVDVAAAAAVDALIMALPAPEDLVLGDKAQYNEVTRALKALTPDQSALVTKIFVLGAATARMAELMATDLVVKAELSNLQADVDDAQAIVTDLPDGALKTDLQARLDAVQVIIDAAALADAKANAVTQLNAAYNGYTETNYTPENWTLLGAAKDDGLNAIAAATSVGDVTIAEGNAEIAMAAVTPGL